MASVPNLAAQVLMPFGFRVIFTGENQHIACLFSLDEFLSVKQELAEILVLVSLSALTFARNKEFIYFDKAS